MWLLMAGRQRGLSMTPVVEECLTWATTEACSHHWSPFRNTLTIAAGTRCCSRASLITSDESLRWRSFCWQEWPWQSPFRSLTLQWLRTCCLRLRKIGSSRVQRALSWRYNHSCRSLADVASRAVTAHCSASQQYEPAPRSRILLASGCGNTASCNHLAAAITLTWIRIVTFHSWLPHGLRGHPCTVLEVQAVA